MVKSIGRKSFAALRTKKKKKKNSHFFLYYSNSIRWHNNCRTQWFCVSVRTDESALELQSSFHGGLLQTNANADERQWTCWAALLYLLGRQAIYGCQERVLSFCFAKPIKIANRSTSMVVGGGKKEKKNRKKVRPWKWPTPDTYNSPLLCSQRVSFFSFQRLIL